MEVDTNAFQSPPPPVKSEPTNRRTTTKQSRGGSQKRRGGRGGGRGGGNVAKGGKAAAAAVVAASPSVVKAGKPTGGPNKCAICNVGYPTKASLDAHKKLHIGDKPYKCGLCGEQFAACAALNAHFKTHPGVKPSKSRKFEFCAVKEHYVCHNCGLKCAPGCALKTYKIVVGEYICFP